MKADAWMPLYVNDYLGATMRLTTEQHGAYLLLIMEGWKSGGPLPDDDNQLAAIAKMSVRDWRKIAPVIRRYFTAANGELIQSRLTREVAKAQRLSEARRESGLKGGRPPKAKGKLEESEPKPIGFSSDNLDALQTETPTRVARHSHSPSSVSNETVSGKPNGHAPSVSQSDVAAIWAEASAKGRERSGRRDLERALKAAAKRGHAPAAIQAAIRRYYASEEATREDGQYAKGVHRLVEMDRWQTWAETELKPATPERWRARLEMFAEQGSWSPDWGPKPGEIGCQAPAEEVANVVPFDRSAA